MSELEPFYFTIISNRGLNSEIDIHSAKRLLDQLGLSYYDSDLFVSTKEELSLEEVAKLLNAVYDKELIDYAEKIREEYHKNLEDNERLRRENKSLRFEKNSLEEGYSKLLDRYSNIDALARRYQEKIQSLDADNETQTNINSEQEFNFHERERELKEQINFLTERINFLNHDVDHYLSLYESEVTRNKGLNEFLRVKSEEKKALIKDNNELDLILSELRSEKEELTKGLSHLRGYNLKLLNDIDQLDGERKSLESQVAKLSLANYNLISRERKLIDRLENIEIILGTKEGEIVDYKKQLSEKDEKIANLETSLEEEKEKYQRENSLLENKLRLKGSKIEELETKIEESDIMSLSLIQSNSEQEDRIVNLSTENMDQRIEIYTLKQEYENLRKIAVKTLEERIDLLNSRANNFKHSFNLSQKINLPEYKNINKEYNNITNDEIYPYSSTQKKKEIKEIASLLLESNDLILENYQRAVELRNYEEHLLPKGYWARTQREVLKISGSEDQKRKLDEIVGLNLKKFKDHLKIKESTLTMLSNIDELNSEIENLKKLYLKAELEWNPRLENRVRKKFNERLDLSSDKKEDLEKASEVYRKHLESEPKNTEFINHYISTNKKLGNLEDVIEGYTKLIEINPLLSENWHMRAIAKIELNDFEGSIQDYDKAINLSPTNSTYWFNRGVVKYNINDITNAIEDFTKAIELSPLNDKCWGIRGIAKKKAGQLESAILDLTKAIEINKKNYEYWSYRGDILFDIKNYIGAIADYNESLKLEPDSTGTLYQRGLANVELWYCNPEEKEFLKLALGDLSKLLEIDPDHKKGLEEIKEVKAILGDHVGAIQSCDKLLSKDKNRSEIWNCRGLSNFELNNYEEAINDYNQSIELDKGSAIVWNNRSKAKMRFGDYAGALEDCTEASKLNPDNCLITKNFIEINKKLGNFENVVDGYTRLIKINPNSYFHWHNRAVANEKLGNDRRAFEDYGVVLRLDPKNQLASDNRYKIFTQLREKGEEVSWTIHGFSKPKVVRPTSNSVKRYKNQPKKFEPLKPTKISHKKRSLLTIALLGVLTIEAGLLGSYLSKEYFDINPIEYAYEMKEKISNKIFE